MIQAVLNWSGGKDCALCLSRCNTGGEINVRYLLTTLNGEENRIQMHGINRPLLRKQAECMGVNLKEIILPANPSNALYDEAMKNIFSELIEEGITHSVYGDIFLEDLREYREKRLGETGIKGVFPLWKNSTAALIEEFIELGFKAVVVCVNGSCLDESFLGRELDRDFIKDLPSGVDPCGEHGEFHTFVYDGPVFKKPVPFIKGEAICNELRLGRGTSVKLWNLELITAD